MNTLLVEKMKCGGCVSNITQAVKAQDNQATVEANISAKTVQIESHLDGSVLAKIITDAGYPAKLQG